MRRDDRRHELMIPSGATRVLFRTFFAQFFASESVTSDIQLRQTLIWVLAFLIAPCLVLAVELFPHFQWVAIRAVRSHDLELLNDTLEWVEALFITHSMVTTGLITVFVWDALTFDHRDAMVLGPLPIAGVTIASAKLAALGVFLVSVSLVANLPVALLFALETSDQFGAVVFGTHFFAHLAATVGGGMFVSATIVSFRGLVVLAAGPRMAAALGPFMQFLFVVAILSLVFLSPAVWKIPHAALVNPDATGWLPFSWFLGMFERIRGSTRLYFMPLATRAFVALPGSIAVAALVSVTTFRRQMRLALMPPAKPGSIGVGASVRRLARLLAGRDPAARATADFVTMTLARNRRQQGPVAISAAIGAAIVLASLVQYTGGFASLTRPRTLVLWIPLVLTYWTVIGLRAAFLMPSELSAAVTFAVNGPAGTRAYWSAVRAAMIALLAPAVTVITLAVTGPLLGWRVAAWHTAFVAGMVAALVELAVLALDRVPFTRPYAAGDAKLRRRWPLYFLGMYVFAFFPVRIELRLLGGQEPWLVAAAMGGAITCHLIGRARARRWSVEPPEELLHDGGTISVLNLGHVIRPVPAVNRGAI
jgi:hypothetical protein